LGRKKVYQIQFLGTDDTYANIGFSSFGMLNAVLVLDGDVAFMGIPYDAVDGASFKEKRTQLSRFTVDNYKMVIAKKGGFFCRFTNGSSADGSSIMVLPSGFFIITAGVNARFLRWALYADASDHQRSKSALRNIITAFPEMLDPSTGYAEYAEHVGVMPS
jgi:hypothetical protein